MHSSNRAGSLSLKSIIGRPWPVLTALPLALLSSWPAPVLGGGGGERMFLIVNPNDENAVRIANAYQQIRAIPESNILFIAPSPPAFDYGGLGILKGDFRNTYINPTVAALAQRGITNQI